MNEKIYTEVLFNNFLENQKNPEKFKSFFDKFVLFLKSKDLQSLLPKIVKNLENKIENNEEKNKTIITVKEASDVKKLSSQIMNSNFNLDHIEIVENKNITGGFIIQDNKKMLDNSYKTKLLQAYKHLTSN